MILFGAGTIGKEAIEFFGKDKVAYFSDNNPSNWNKNIFGVEIISFQKLCKIQQKYTIIICANVEKSHQIVNQFLQNGIRKFIVFENLKKQIQEKNINIEQLLEEYIYNNIEYAYQIDYLERKNYYLQQKLDYINEYAKIELIKKETGYKHLRQKEMALFAKNFLGKLKQLIDITPFLIKDSLVGYIKCRGFLPWILNMSFGLTQNEYVKLLKCCNNKFVVKYVNTLSYKDLNQEILKHKGEELAFIFSEHVEITIGNSLFDRKWINIYLVDSYNPQVEEYIFPLKCVLYEHFNCYVPRQAEKYSEYENENYEIYKENLGFDNNEAECRDYIEKNLISIEFYLVDSFEVANFEPWYKFFRKNGIYAIYVAEPEEYNVSGKYFDYKNTKNILDKRNLEFKTKCNRNAIIAFTTQENSILRKYSKNTKRINLSYGCSLNKNAYWFQKRAADGFDYKFVHGEFAKQQNLQYLSEDRIKVVGMPKYFGIKEKCKNYNKENILKELNIKTKKAILVYYPTWDEDSSIDLYYNILLELKKQFYIVIKPHHCTWRLPSKKSQKEKLIKLADYIVDVGYSFEKSCFLGDINICDAKSGAALELTFINNDAKMILLSMHKKEEDYYFNILYKMFCVVSIDSSLFESVQQIFDSDVYIDVRKRYIKQFISEEDEKELKKIWKEIKKKECL
ncbi:MAG: CDP-glycerol glycerophosphotransferase family protein [Candidatus Gastranaerophilaceae bacterium]